jgi:hypothetical protein
VLGARVLASVMRVRREAYFHRDNDRKLGGGIQGLECCELYRGLGAGEEFSGGAGFRVVRRGRGKSQNTNPSHVEGFGTPASFISAWSKLRCRVEGWPPA